MPEQPEDRMSGSGSRGSRGSRRSRVTDQVREAPVVELADESAPASVYDDFTDRDSLGGHSAPPLPIKPPGNLPPGSIGVDPRLAGNTADEYYNDIVTTPSDEVPASPSQALSRRRTSSHGLSHSHSHSHSPSHGHSSRRTRSHSSAREVLRLLLKAEGTDSREALAMLRRAHDRLESENLRANEAERRVQEANDRWKVINQARLQAQAEASRINEELRLYKLQLETAQQQIARANDMIAQTDKEKDKAEDEAAKARRLAKKYEIESLIQKAREEGRRIGRQQGLQEGMENAYYDDRAYGRDYYDRDRELYENGRPYDEQTYDGRTIIDDDRYTNDYREDGRHPMQYVPNPQGTADPRVQRSRPTPRTPTGIPPRTRSVPGEASSRGPRNSILNGLSRLGRGRRHGPEMDRNVAVNPSNAPDVASIVDEMPVNPITSPLPAEEISQVNHTTPVRMPEPDFNPDPNDVPPISMPNRPRSPAHPPIHIPPDGYIPSQGLDGSIRLPPPHELGQAPPTPRSYDSPLPNASNLPPAEPAVLPQRERSPITRDYGLPQEQSRPSRRHRYQKSVADSDDSIATGAFSLVSPPDGRQTLMRDNRLSAIPEHDPRYASPSGSMRQAEGAMYPGTPRSRSSRRGDAYISPEPVMVEEPPVRPDLGAAFSPRSTRSGFGPPRPSRLTTPAPLAPSLGADNYDQPAYTRPRINSVASGSDIGGPIGGPGGTPRPSRSRNMTPASEYRRSRPPTATGVQTPEITITQAV
ncbi:uncharacterized protein FOMMEDRAFT_155280 [Fomitiporia mediterranea MF3/22]|uniref:uncharacterized protein n=1 Tax=Fomitiporia mediterranea (strain MF3/22) TaxID=694068 RepID=UPI0004409CC7|nr:uncharacterized protein FOMMEDRAFT_155280 [Fomitiporia mediterranea MF3/22]EJD04160.1 hypothetical protein FOMMEDRAFT_155280 [Fomitiporia mediterranea MF3/22]